MAITHNIFTDSVSDACVLADKYNCKYIETSAELGHQTDELLVGMLRQIRLKLSTSQEETFCDVDKMTIKKHHKWQRVMHLCHILNGPASSVDSCQDLFRIWFIIQNFMRERERERKKKKKKKRKREDYSSFGYGWLLEESGTCFSLSNNKYNDNLEHLTFQKGPNLSAYITMSSRVSVLTFFTLKRVLVALEPPGGLPIVSHF